MHDLIEVSLNKFAVTSNYQRNGVACFLCESRRKLIQITPEEKVRQAVINFLKCKLNVPADRILAEVPLSHYVKGAAGRVDILIIDKEGKPVLIVECKEESQDLRVDAILQAKRYDRVLKAGAILATNGIEAHFAVFDDKANGYKALAKIPNYKNLTNWKWFSFLDSKTPTFLRPVISRSISQKTVQEYIQQGWLGEDTNPALYPFIFNLKGWLFDWQDKIEPSSITSVNLIEDSGIRYAKFGNAGGGNYTGTYRFFIIEDEGGSNQIISLGLYGNVRTLNHPQMGNRKGTTVLIVAIDDYESSHNSLELNLDRHVEVNGDQTTVWHDGSLTIGRYGGQPREIVINFIQSQAPYLVRDGKVFLGTLNTEREISSKQPETLDFFNRLVEYANLRDKYRKIVNSKIKSF